MTISNIATFDYGTYDFIEPFCSALFSVTKQSKTNVGRFFGLKEGYGRSAYHVATMAGGKGYGAGDDVFPTRT